MAWVLKEGYGYNVGQDFNRATADTPIELAPKEFAQPGHIIGYIAGNPQSSLSFMRSARVRIHVRKQYLAEV